MASSTFASLSESQSERRSSRAALSSFGRRPAAGATETTPTQLIGTVDNIRVFGDWAIAFLFDANLKESKITGAMVAEMKSGQEYVVTGSAKNHPKHGSSFEVSSASPHVAPNERSIVRFLVNNFKGVGEKSATKFVEKVVVDGGLQGLETFRQQLLNAPWDIDVAAINSRGAYSPEEREKTTLAFIQRDLATKLAGIEGVRAPVLSALAKRLAAKLSPLRPGQKPVVNPVTASWNTLAADPYEPIASVPGYGFVMADTIGRQVGIARNAPQRLAALVAHATREGCEQAGHVYLSTGQVGAAIARLDPTVAVAEAIAVARERNTVAIDEESEALPRIYPTSLLRAEKSAAKHIAALCEPGSPLSSDRRDVLERKIQSAAKSLGGVFSKGVDNSQLNALVNILTTRVRIHTLTAEPGAGKTAVMEVLAKLLQKKTFVFCAPTGQAAKVLGNRLKSGGNTASTIHSTLQGSGPHDFAVDESNPLEGDILAVDESSMPDIAMADAVLRAMNKGMHIILSGDDNQLQSIAPGRFLSDLLAIPQVDHNRLTEVHRNSGRLLEVIRQIRDGQVDTASGEGVSFSGALPSPEEGFAEVVDKYLGNVRSVGYANAGLLMSRKKGDPTEPGWNTTYSNAVLRDICNPNAPKVPGTALHVGDRIIVKENMVIDDERVVNGDTGSIKSFTMGAADARNKSTMAGPSLSPGRQPPLCSTPTR